MNPKEATDTDINGVLVKQNIETQTPTNLLVPTIPHRCTLVPKTTRRLQSPKNRNSKAVPKNERSAATEESHEEDNYVMCLFYKNKGEAMKYVG